MDINAFVCWIEHKEPWAVEADIFNSVSLPLNIQDNKHHHFSAILSGLRKKARELPIANEENQQRRK